MFRVLIVSVLFHLFLGSTVTGHRFRPDILQSSVDRVKRQVVNNCDDDTQFRCTDGACIEDYMKCNGKADCSDESDETVNACLDHYCPPFAFRCSYGGCIAGRLECNGRSDCVDGSDELSLNCPGVKEMYSRKGNCSEDNFQCANGQCVHEEDVCNGKRDCSDGSEETVALCSNHYCPSYAFRCAYGGCVSGKSRCNDIIDCADGSDESQALCGRPPPTVAPPVNRPAGSCAIPVLENGRVVSLVTNATYRTNQFAQNGERLVFMCNEATLVGVTDTYCIEGELISDPPRCIKGCSTLSLDTLSVRATCADKQLKTIACTEVVPPTTVARLVCKSGYKKPVAGSFEDTIYCRQDGNWNTHVGRCEPVCGEITFGVPYVSGGRVSNISQVPWHVAIYEKQNEKFNQICGGTIISQTAVLSAAHCFWDEARDTVKDISSFSVIAGKSLRDYYTSEAGMQLLQIQEIRVQAGYLGNVNLFSGDIAVLHLMTPIIYQTFIAPICITFHQYAAKNVASGTTGRIAGWGITEDNLSSPVLKVVDLEAVDYDTCRRNADRSFVPYIGPDKFCATRPNENVCQGDSGGGFSEGITREDGAVKYYLRGLVSVGSKLGSIECRANNTYTTFTNILFHEGLFFEFTQV